MTYSKCSIRHFVEQELGILPHFVIYAILEWMLIGLLFLDGFLAFVSSEFADFFDLQAPCILCTRIDHILTRNKARYCHNETICDGHKKDLSSLAYCHVHRKLSDIRSMCEGCLLSFATNNNNNKLECTKAYRSHNEGLNKDLDGLFDDDLKARLQLQPLDKDYTTSGVENSIYCSCCGELMKVKPTGCQKSGSNGNNNGDFGFSSNMSIRLPQAPIPSPRTPFASRRAEEVRANLELSQIRCSELKLSDTYTPNEDDTTNVDIHTETKEEIKPLLMSRPSEHEYLMEDFGRALSFSRGSRFFGISDSAAASPRFANRMPRKSLLDKVELASDPAEVVIGNETDTELILNRLKKQVRLDRKSLIALYMELDEERSASAVAANNAMAMITRLQAEKASVQMEALQYQRMMEEQAEYDKEDIQLLKDFLIKKEDEIRGLEAELDLSRGKYGLPHVTRDDGLEKSQSFSSITEHESPLFNIAATNIELDVNENISNKSSSARSSFEEGENNNHKNGDYMEYNFDGSSCQQEDDHIRHINYKNFRDDVVGSSIDIDHEGSFLLGQLKLSNVEETPLFS